MAKNQTLSTRAVPACTLDESFCTGMTVTSLEVTMAFLDPNVKI